MENREQLQQEYLRNNNEGSFRLSRKSPDSKEPSPLLPAAELKDITQWEDNSGDRLSPPLDIQRPRSALHAGDFTHDSADSKSTPQEPLRRSKYPSTTFHNVPLGTSPTTPWYTPSSLFNGFGSSPQVSPRDTSYMISDQRPLRSRAPSLTSYSASSYVLKAPTTPLVQQSNNTDLDFSPLNRSISPEKSSRRHTLPPHSFHNLHSSPNSQSSAASQAARHPPSYRREGTFPYSHHSRRSLTSNWSLQASSSPQTPAYLRSRRTSFSSETSPLQNAHMVGSYEESILRGWMSTAPSKPLDFTAQIGVLGKGNCKPKCPAHITIPFPAVFYNWSSNDGRGTVNDDPSPYVGHIDLHTLAPAESKETRKNRIQNPKVEAMLELKASNSDPERDFTIPKPTPRRPKKRRRTFPVPTPPGGSYRIPEQGQLQIIIKNPNKTAVKLFLVPYDLLGMEAGMKTFVRQRSYSADPVIDSPLTSKASTDPALLSKKPTLRYLIHLNICSPSKGRYYLYQQIRVVFANRVPDNKEQLRNEIQVPQPRFSAYKPNKDSLSGPSSSAGAKLIAEKAYRRRSSGFGFGTDDLEGHNTQIFAGGSAFRFTSGAPVPPLPAIPFNLTVSRQRPTREENQRDDADLMELDTSRPTTASDMQSPLSDKSNHFHAVQFSSSYQSTSSQSSDSYGKLNKGDSGYGGVFGRPGTPEPGEGLLTRRLKGLGVQRDRRQAEEEM